ncbi:hypothetical protein [Desulfosediminicola flagellatus]|uniref:hypothetical protein n=1 Tax=Desulfosediminicola flagellatus TaxID=2569541 RepID=UPI00129487D1|nr:hypothetical protein [Desulfosediminicola flagellatus]
MKEVLKKDTAKDVLVSIDVIAVMKNRSFAGAVLVDSRFVKSVLKKINGVSAMVLPGFARIANASE